MNDLIKLIELSCMSECHFSGAIAGKENVSNMPFSGVFLECR